MLTPVSTTARWPLFSKPPHDRASPPLSFQTHYRSRPGIRSQTSSPPLPLTAAGELDWEQKPGLVSQAMHARGGESTIVWEKRVDRFSRCRVSKACWPSFGVLAPCVSAAPSPGRRTSVHEKAYTHALTHTEREREGCEERDGCRCIDTLGRCWRGAR
ncbi:hypothetical protein LY78DRAFT_129797 [Colletotrichum sublineola]|nr:hypothetical protein LY78DRAFT_129797 [Colletotrichum sublineola]